MWFLIFYDLRLMELERLIWRKSISWRACKYLIKSVKSDTLPTSCTTSGPSLPTQVTAVAGASAIAAGTSHSLALRADGTVLAWGSNGQGQLGDGSAIGR